MQLAFIDAIVYDYIDKIIIYHKNRSREEMKKMKKKVKIIAMIVMASTIFILSACENEEITKIQTEIGDEENSIKQTVEEKDKTVNEDSSIETDIFADKFVVKEGEDFSEGLAMALIYTEEDGERYAIIDKEQRILFELPYMKKYGFPYRDFRYRSFFENGGLLWEDSGDFLHIYDEKGNMIDLTKEYDSVSNMGNGYYLAKKNPSGYQRAEVKSAVINSQGEEVIPLSEELTEYAENGKYGDGVILNGCVCVMGKEEKIVTVDSKLGILLAKKGDRLISEGGIFDLDGNLIEEYYPDYSYRHSDPYVSDNTIILFDKDSDPMKFRVFDFEGNKISEEILDDISVNYITDFSDGYCVITINGSDGLYVTMLDEMGKFAFEPIKLREEFLDRRKLETSEGTLIYPIDERSTGCIDKTGKMLFTIDVPWLNVKKCSDGCIGFQGYVGYNYIDVEQKKCIFDYAAELVHFIE